MSATCIFKTVTLEVNVRVAIKSNAAEEDYSVATIAKALDDAICRDRLADLLGYFCELVSCRVPQAGSLEEEDEEKEKDFFDDDVAFIIKNLPKIKNRAKQLVAPRMKKRNDTIS